MNPSREVVESWEKIGRAMERDRFRFRRVSPDPELSNDRCFVHAGEPLLRPAALDLDPWGRPAPVV